MSSLAFLVTELQSLASETKRKYPEIREAAEKSLTILRASPEQATASLASDGPQTEDLLRPVFMGCSTKNAKVVAISLGSLQRLITLKAVPQSAVANIINTMSVSMNQGVDIQLRILQTLTQLITNFPAVHGQLLGEALLLCFKLQESRIAVVSSTAAATLRQLVMFVVDKVVEEDKREDVNPQELSDTSLPDGTTKALGPSAVDAFAVFEDLCLLANAERPHFLKLDYLHKTFALELIESVLTNYHDLFRQHAELLLLLQHHLCPLLLKALSDRPVFPLTLRCTRVVFLLLKQFSLELKTESEVFLVLLIKIVGEEGDSSASGSSDNLPTVAIGAGVRPPWMRVLAMEIMRGLCSDAELMRNIWARYDAEEDGSKVFTSLIAALKRLVTEKPALLGVGTQMMGVGVESGSALNVSGMAGMVATAASATVSNMVGIMGAGASLSLSNSAMKIQCIDQLDKADSPAIPEAYLYLLGVQCLVALCEGLATFAGPLYSSIVIQKPRAAGAAPVRAPPALDLSTLSPEDPAAQQLHIVRAMIDNGWPALMAALSFVIATNLSDELFADVLGAYQALTNVSGMLGLTTPRDAFFTSLARLAIPTSVVSSLDTYVEPPTPKSAGALENLGLAGAAQAPGLSERNMACLKVLVSSASFLAGSLGESWFNVLETLQNADYVITSKGAGMMQRSTSNPGGIAPSRSASGPFKQGPTGSAAPASSQQGARHPLLVDLDSESLQSAIQRLFDATKNLDDDAFKEFVDALCKLSSEMVGMQANALSEGRDTLSAVPESESVEDASALSPKSEVHMHRRRVSGIHLPRTLRSGDFGIRKLGDVAMLNVHRLIYRSPNVAWNTTTSHLLSIIWLSSAPQSIRTQAARVLDDILVIVPRNLSTTGELQSTVQRQVLDVLSKQVIPDSGAAASSQTGVELRRMGLETLHQILQASGHTLVVGWETIFEMLGSVCRPAPPPRSASVDSSLNSTPTGISRPKPLPLGYANDRSYASLVKIAFQSMTLVCDSISLLSPEHLRLCIATLGQFGRQADTNIALTAAESLLWSVSDSIQAKRKDQDHEAEYSALWMSLLLEILNLCIDARPEVRGGAIQTLFRTMQLYGGTLSLETWDECLWKVTFPLLDSITLETRHADVSSPPLSGNSAASASPQSSQPWNDSKILALHSIGSIFNDFFSSKIMRLESFVKAWDLFVGHIQETVLLDDRSVSEPALRCLEKSVTALGGAEASLRPKVSEALERVWSACDTIGESVAQQASAQSKQSAQPFTQVSLVALVDVLRCTRSVSRAVDSREWPLERLERLVFILKGVITYPNSPDYRLDTDGLSPLQAVVMQTLEGVDLSLRGSSSLIMRDLSEYATLAFLAAFDVVQTVPTSSPPKRVTYIALAKKTMPLLVDLYLRFKDQLAIYEDGTVESVLSAYSIPVKLKYDCPPPSKFGRDEPLWKTATSNFLRIVKELSAQLPNFKQEISDEHTGGIWRQVIDVFKGGILADCSAVESLPLKEQEAEENFDLALIAALEIDVIPHLGDARVPDSLIQQLARVLQQGSRLHDSADDSDGSHIDWRSTTLLNGAPAKGAPQVNGYGAHEQPHSLSDLGSTQNEPILPRERFSYWCFDLLFLICSQFTTEREASRRRVAALSITPLLNRSQSTLAAYIADGSLRGNLPFSRAREDELLYVLRKLLALKLWPGTLWAALSESPSKYAIEQPPLDAAGSPSQIIADAIKRSPAAHLFHLYGLFCEIASAPRTTPSAWLATNMLQPLSPKSGISNLDNDVSDTADAVRIDARSLARQCLKEIGKEMSMDR